MGIYENILNGFPTGTQTIEVVVRLKINEGYNIQEVVSEMDYDFDHPAILLTEIVDINTEI